MQTPVTVVIIRSPSYSGTTWINILLGCHEDAFALGPANRVLSMLEDPSDTGDKACRVHGETCTFWPQFFKNYDRSGNFYVQLAAATGKRVIVTNNPYTGEAASAHLDHPQVKTRYVNVVRDGRAIVASYLKYHPEADLLETVRDWFAPFAETLPFDPDNHADLSVTYESVVSDQKSFIEAAGSFLGLQYPERFFRFWEFEHHAAAGNPGPLGTIRRHLGRPFAGVDTEESERRYQQLLSDPQTPRLDASWESELGRRDRLIFDHFAGATNERWGYRRDRFNVSEVREFQRLIGESPQSSTPTPAEVQPTPLPPLLREALRPHSLRTEGLHLRPGQVKKLGRNIVAVYLAAVVVVAIVAGLLF